MRHILDLKIENFRGLQNVEIKMPGAVNLIVGGNNTGKTSVLEAIELVCNPMNIAQFLATARGRDRSLLPIAKSRLPVEDSIEWLFPLASTNQDWNADDIPFNRQPILLHSLIHGKENIYEINYNELKVVKDVSSYNFDESTEVRALEVFMQHSVEGVAADPIVFISNELPRGVRTKPNFRVPTHMVTPVDHRVLPLLAKSLTKSFRSDKAGLVHLMQMFDQDIIGIDLLSNDDRSTIPHLKHRYKSYIPISVYGDGMRRVLTLAAAVIRAKRGVLLIDEIETALHPRMLGKVFSWLVEACAQFNVQLFATTHSLEAIDALLKTFVEVDLDTDDILLGRLESIVGYRLVQKGETVVKRFEGKELYTLRNEYGQDVR